MPDFNSRVLCVEPPSMLQVSQSHAEQQQNWITPPREMQYYAFLDVVEEVDPGQLVDEDEPTFVWTHLAPPGGERTPLEGRLPLVMAVFDCVLCEYFNNNIEDHRQFYKNYRQGQDIDAPHDLLEENWQDPKLSKIHRALNDKFLAFTGPNFISVRLLFPNTVENRRAFKLLFSGWFAGERWCGLGLTDRGGLPVEIWAHTESGEDQKFTDFQPSILCVYQVDAIRLNNLKHVISLDFAPDVYFPPSTYPAPPKPVPVVNSSGAVIVLPIELQQQIGAQIGAQNYHYKHKKKLYVAKPSRYGIHDPPRMKKKRTIMKTSMMATKDDPYVRRKKIRRMLRPRAAGQPLFQPGPLTVY